MRTLVIDTVTAACSVALFDNERIVATTYEVIDRGHAERLVPMIAALPGGGRADAILVDRGPGSFTGVRVGLAAARGLALGWGVPVLAYSSLTLVAVMAHAAESRLDQVAAVLEGGHGEVYMQMFDLSPFAHLTEPVSLPPEAALALIGGLATAGRGVARLSKAAWDRVMPDLLPDAASAMLLPPIYRTNAATPLYGRGPDAKLPA